VTDLAPPKTAKESSWCHPLISLRSWANLVSVEGHASRFIPPVSDANESGEKMEVEQKLRKSS
jgi:hypothetical protein